MLKGLSRLWLSGLARAGKVQQSQAAKLFKSMLIKPKPKVKRKSKTIQRPSAAPANTRAASKARVLEAPANPKTDAGSNQLPGKLLASYYSPLADDGMLLPLRRMRYYLYLPDRFPAQLARDHQEKKTWPLIVMLHGCEQTAPEFSQGTGMNQRAGKKGYAVLYPEQSLRSHRHRCWKWYDKATQDGDGDVKMIVGMIEKVAEKYPIDRTRIYICGISAGAAMANIVALNHPQLIAAVGLHSGPMFGAGHSLIGAYGVMQHGANNRVGTAIAEVLHKHPEFPAMPTILIQGQGDKIVRPINQTQLVQQTLLLNRLAAESAVPVVAKPAGRVGSRNPGRAYEIGDFYLRKKLLLRVARIAHLEHAWSGGDGSLAFNSPSGPDASKMMLEFFARHRRLIAPHLVCDAGRPVR
ncbi:MAG: PHB depolymerase family esterase [Glaciimonas sp.]|nr:PHB depolymerase family esterase [Glaciimonas sp.]